MITSSNLRELADRSLSEDAPYSMSEPFRNRLGMGAITPARIQPGSIDHVPFPTVVPCLGASFFGFTIKPARPDAAPFRIIIYRPFFPPVPSRMKIVVCMFDFGCRCNRIGGSILWQDQSPGQTNPPPRRIVLCPPDPYRAKELPGDP